MGRNIEIVTDSASSLPKNIAKDNKIGIVPASILFRNQQFLDGIEIDTDEILRLMEERKEIPSTAAPSIGDYKRVYDGFSSDKKIFSVHLIGKFSNIFNAACMTAKEYPENKITTYDSETISMGIGFMALKAAELSDKGASIEQIKAELDDMRQRTVIFAAIDSLQHLHRGGRIKAAEQLFGTLLQIKPIVEFSDNQINIKDKTRTRTKSITHLVELTNTFGEKGLEQVAVLHAGAKEDADKIADGIRNFYKGDIPIFDAGAVLTVQGGPRVIGVALVKKNI